MCEKKNWNHVLSMHYFSCIITLCIITVDIVDLIQSNMETLKIFTFAD